MTVLVSEWNVYVPEKIFLSKKEVYTGEKSVQGDKESICRSRKMFQSKKKVSMPQKNVRHGFDRTTACSQK